MPSNDQQTFFEKKQESSARARRSETIIGKGLPASIEAEKALLAALLLNSDNITLVSDLVHAQDFYQRNHQLLYQVLVELLQATQYVDLIVLQDALEKKGILEEIGGITYLIELQEDIPSIGLVKQHARIIKSKAILRELIHSAADIIETCYDQKVEKIDEVLDNAEKKIYHIAHKISPPSFVKIDILLKETFKQLSEVKSHQGQITGIPSSFKQFDEMTSGMQRGDLLILAARPSMGKTALAMNIALSAWKHEFPVGIFSLEMPAEQLVLRTLASETEIPYQKIRNALVSTDEWMVLTNHAAYLSEAQIFIDDTAGLNIMELRAKARKLKAEQDIKLLVIDYLQLINSHVRHENRNQEISAISRSLKALAKELDIPILALSQLSRSLENRMDKRPMLSDLRESGAIEQDADVVFFIYRDVVYNPDTENPNLAEIIIGKQRNGPTGSFYVNFKGNVIKFEDIPESHTKKRDYFF